MKIAGKSLLAFIRLYQVLIAPLLGTNCRFTPSCSCYARDAVMKHGALKGGLLAAKRVIKCNPFGPSGYDPV